MKWSDLAVGDVIYHGGANNTPVYLLIEHIGTRIIKWYNLLCEDTFESTNEAQDMPKGWVVIRGGKVLQ